MKDKSIHRALHLFFLAISNNSTKPEKGKQQNKQKKNVLLVQPVAVALALNHVEVPWLFAVMEQPIFEQFWL